jgi:hypothetical protein
VSITGESGGLRLGALASASDDRGWGPVAHAISAAHSHGIAARGSVIEPFWQGIDSPAADLDDGAVAPRGPSGRYHPRARR